MKNSKEVQTSIYSLFQNEPTNMQTKMIQDILKKTQELINLQTSVLTQKYEETQKKIKKQQITQSETIHSIFLENILETSDKFNGVEQQLKQTNDIAQSNQNEIACMSQKFGNISKNLQEKQKRIDKTMEENKWYAKKDLKTLKNNINKIKESNKKEFSSFYEKMEQYKANKEKIKQETQLKLQTKQSIDTLTKTVKSMETKMETSMDNMETKMNTLTNNINTLVLNIKKVGENVNNVSNVVNNLAVHAAEMMKVVPPPTIKILQLQESNNNFKQRTAALQTIVQDLKAKVNEH